MLRQVAHGMLERIGLGEHEALIVGHQDTRHAHVHLMVNRVHPETGKTWERWHDYAKIERALRAMEVELGLRIVPGRHAPVPEIAREQADIDRLVGNRPATREGTREGTREPVERPAEVPGSGRRPAELDDAERQPGYVDRRTKGEEREVRRTGETPLVEDARLTAGLIRAARTWDELALLLDAAGLRVERKGQGLVVTDGAREVKASRVDRGASRSALEARFGETYAAWEARSARPPERATERPTERPAERLTERPAERPSTRPTAGQPGLPPARPTLAPAAVAAGLVRNARGWDELAVYLDAAGLRARREVNAGGGVDFVVSRGSWGRPGPEARTPLADVEARFGEAYGAWRRRAVGERSAGERGAAAPPRREPVSLSGRYLATVVTEFTEVMRARAALVTARDDQDKARVARDTAAAAGMGRADAEAALAQALRAVFRDPIAAERELHAAVRQHGQQAAADLLRRTPERFGDLRGAPDPARRSAFGSFADRVLDRMTGRAREDAAALAAARRAAGEAAAALRTWDDARRRVERQAGTVYDARRAPARAAEVDGRVARLEAILAARGAPAVVAAEVARVLPRVPAEERARVEARLRPEAVGVLRAFAATVPAHAPDRDAGARGSRVAASYADREAVSAVVHSALGALGALGLRPELRRAAAPGELPPRLREEIREAWGRVGDRPQARDPRERPPHELGDRARGIGRDGGRGSGGMER